MECFIKVTILKPKFKLLNSYLYIKKDNFLKLIMSDYKRNKCPKCGNENPRKIHEEPDKRVVLYYSMQGMPVYKMQLKCGECGNIFDKG